MSQLENNDNQVPMGLPGMPPAAGSKVGGSGGFGPEGLPEAFGGDAKKKPLITSGTLLVMVLFIISAGGLYVMNYTQMGITESGKNSKDEKTIEKYLALVSKEGSKGTVKRIGHMGLKDSKVESINKLLSVDVASHQVPVESLRKDPFQVKLRKQPGKGTTNKKDESIRKKKKQMMIAFARRLRITGILTGGAVPTAIIHVNGKRRMYDQGSKVGPFVLTKITRKMVIVNGIKVSRRYVVFERKNYHRDFDFRVSIPVKK